MPAHKVSTDTDLLWNLPKLLLQSQVCHRHAKVGNLGGVPGGEGGSRACEANNGEGYHVGVGAGVQQKSLQSQAAAAVTCTPRAAGLQDAATIYCYVANAMLIAAENQQCEHIPRTVSAVMFGSAAPCTSS